MEKPIIYACSDSLGETAERVARAAASQYDKQEFNIIRVPYIRSEQQIEELTDSAREPHVVEIAGKTYCDKSMSRYDREEMADPLTATSLNSLIDYISGKSEELRESMKMVQ